MEVYEFLSGFTNGSGARKSRLFAAVEKAQAEAKVAMRKLTKETGHKFAADKEIEEPLLARWVSETTNRFYAVLKVTVEE